MNNDRDFSISFHDVCAMISIILAAGGALALIGAIQ